MQTMCRIVSPVTMLSLWCKKLTERFLFQLLPQRENTVIWREASNFSVRIPPSPQLRCALPKEHFPLWQPCIRARPEEEVHHEFHPAPENHNSHHHGELYVSGQHHCAENVKKCGKTLRISQRAWYLTL